MANYIGEQMNVINNGLDYLTSIYALSQCDCLIAGLTNGSLVSSIMSNNDYDYYYYYDLGLYP